MGWASWHNQIITEITIASFRHHGLQKEEMMWFCSQVLYNLVGESGPYIRTKQDTDGTKKKSVSKFQKGDMQCQARQCWEGFQIGGRIEMDWALYGSSLCLWGQQWDVSICSQGAKRLLMRHPDFSYIQEDLGNCGENCLGWWTGQAMRTHN